LIDDCSYLIYDVTDNPAAQTSSPESILAIFEFLSLIDF